jgi:hypothetical protein
MRRSGKKVFYAVEGIDGEHIKEAQDLVSRLADSVLSHAGNKHRAPGLDRISRPSRLIRPEPMNTYRSPPARAGASPATRRTEIPPRRRSFQPLG